MSSLFRRMDVRLAVLAYVTCILVQSGGLGSLDTSVRLEATHALWTSEPPLDSSTNPAEATPGRNGVIQNNFGMGQSLVMIPGDIIGTAIASSVHGSPAMKKHVRAAVVAYLTFPLIDALAIVVALRLLCSLGLSKRSSMLGALGLLLLTSFLHYSQSHQENNLVLLCTLTLYWSAVEWLTDSDIWRWVILGALAAGFNLLIRVTTILDFGGLTLFVALLMWHVQRTGGDLDLWRKLRPVLIAGLPILLAAVAIDRLYQFHRFGTFSGTYMDFWVLNQRRIHPALPPNYPFSGRFSVGFFGPFLSERKSIFIFDPTIFFALAGMVGLLPASHGAGLRAVRPILLGTFIELLIVVAFHARFDFWSANVAWGDRYVTAPLHLMCAVGIALVAESWCEVSLSSRTAISAICVISLLVQLSSIVFLPALECEQEETAGHSMFIVGQRFRNVTALFTGQLQAEARKFPRWDSARPSLAPFQLGLPPGRLSRTVQFVWGILVLLDVVFLVRFFRQVIRYRTESVGDSPALRTSI